jgi:hypothetical protein
MSSGIHQGQVAGTRWDPNLYLKFSDHRLRPGLELLDRIPLTSPGVIYDLGCGSGHLARLIASAGPQLRYTGSTILGTRWPRRRQSPAGWDGSRRTSTSGNPANPPI